MRAALIGAALVALYTALIAAADGITTLIAGSYAAPQFLAVSSALKTPWDRSFIPMVSLPTAALKATVCGLLWTNVYNTSLRENCRPL